jgi:hypothetical protein
MPTENTSKLANRILWLFGGLLLVLVHFTNLYALPGLHFDEAWAFNHAVRILNGEWTLQGMSPYTAPWTHYFAAFWLKLLGVGLWQFRFSQILLAMLGLGLIQFTLWKKAHPAWPYFFFVVALIPGLVLNHRFTVELNGFHVFCFGLLILAISQRWWWLAAVAILLGTTAHILFYGWALALLAVSHWEKREFTRAEKLWGSLTALVLALFFWKVFLQIPEKGKALALLASALLAGASLWIPFYRWNWQKSWLDTLAWIFALVFLLNAFFFLEGFWQLSISTGKEAWRGGRIVSLALFLIFSGWLFFQGRKEFPRFWRRVFLLGVIFLGLMMLKQTPRYHEMILLSLAIFLSAGLAKHKELIRFACMCFLALHGALLYSEYFTLNPKEQELRFLTFKDSSRDFLAKQELVSVLGSSGCRLSDIKTGDSRVGEALLALSHGDWEVAPSPCPWKHLERKVESFRAGSKTEIADFVIWEN